MRSVGNFKLILWLSCISLVTPLFGQKTYYGEEPVKWSDNLPADLPPGLDKYSGSDLIILDDQTEFHFYASDNEKIVRYLRLKINTEEGLEALQAYKLPESLDRAYDAHYHKQGRRARIKTPFITEYTILQFAARKFSEKRWSPVPFNLRYEKIRWVRGSGTDVGEFMDEDLRVFELQDLAVGDVVELFYKSAFNSSYGSNLFYFNSQYPKLHCAYTFIYKVKPEFAGHAFMLPVNVKDTCLKKDMKNYKDYSIITDKINLYDLKPVNYPANSFGGKKLPYVFADFSYYRIATGSYPSEAGRIYDFQVFRPKNFQWLFIVDTSNYYTKVYDKQFASIRKFVNKLPPAFGPDSTNTTFIKALCDEFNDFRYISSNHLFYNESNLIGIYSGDHLLKGRLIGHQQWKLYRDILNDNKIFYYVANIQDKRYGEHNLNYRACYSYEKELIAIPSKDSYIYFMPRYHGMKYHLNELPFYLEGSLASLSPRNFQDNTKDKEEKAFKFIKTHKGTFNENTRAENASVRISLDSLKADLFIKESLSGQFSTVLRHLYLNEYIDSTISPHYFKKCVDKPLSSNAKIKLSSKVTNFPFRYNFNCSEKISLTTNKSLYLKNWFSFVLSKNSLPETPLHDYYFDFDFSDSYNFLLNFTTPVELYNAASFTKKINNDYFDLESSITSNSETSYLIRVALVVKQTSIPEHKMNLLMELVDELEDLSDFSLEFARK